MKDVVILVAVPYELYWATEIEVQCENFRKFGYSSALQVVVHENCDNPYRHYWDKLAQKYKEVSFFFYRNDKVKNLTNIYASVSRPITLKAHWEAYPELKRKVILYMDSDVLFSKYLDLSKYVEDDICYISSTDYIAASYFENKRKDVLQNKLEQYDKRDVLAEMAEIVGIDKQVIIDNEKNTGGCQYILKDIDADFWRDVTEHCLYIYTRSKVINKTFFESESKGFQSWALGDMCGVLWNLWKRGKQTQCPEELNFNWATTPIDKYYDYALFHNAGVTAEFMELNGKKERLFNKTDVRLRSSKMTFFDMTFENITENYCTAMYIKAIQEVKDPVCVTENKQLF